MIEYFIPIVSFFCLGIGIIKHKNLYNPVTIFNFWWLLIGMLMNLELFRVEAPNYHALIIIFTGVVFFNLGCFLFELFPKKARRKIKTPNNFKIKDFDLNYKVIKYIALFTLVISIWTAINPISHLLSGLSFSEVRVLYNTVDGAGRSWFIYYSELFLKKPFEYILIIATILDQIFGKRSKPLMLVTLLVVILTALTSGGRYMMVNAVFMIMGVLLITGKINKIKRSQKVKFVILFIILVVGIIYLTNERRILLTENDSILYLIARTAYTYYTGGVTFMGKIIELYSIESSYTYGANFIGGLLAPIFSVLSFFNILPYPGFLKTVAGLTAYPLSIGEGVYYNALPTIFLYFYVDMNIIGVIFGSMFFAMICMYVYNKMKTSQGLYWLSIYLLIFVQLNNTSTYWLFYSSSYLLAFLYIKLITNKKGVKRGKENAE